MVTRVFPISWFVATLFAVNPSIAKGPCSLGNPQEILSALRAARSVVLTSQSPLDGDAVGSELALLELTEQLAPGASVRALNESLPPELYAFLPGIERLGVLSPDEPPPDADLLVVLDCGDLARFRYLPSRFPDARIANLDHHASNTGFGDSLWVAADCSSTGEQVHALFAAAGQRPSRDAATALYLAITFDTGRFAYSNTGPSTLRAAADLVEIGVRPETLFRETERNRSEGALQMTAFAIRNVRREAAGQLAWLTVARTDLTAAGAGPEDLEDLVNVPMALAGVEVSLLLKEVDRGRTKASLRSDRWFDVCAFARHFGGGGHVRAAGMTLDMSLDEAGRTVGRKLAAAIERGEP